MLTMIKAFAVGAALPAFFLPIVTTCMMLTGRQDLAQEQALHFMPLLWGVWNSLYMIWCRTWLPGTRAVRLALSGALLGLLVAVVALLFLDAAARLAVPLWAPLIAAPIGYALVWVLAIGPMNALVGLEDNG